MERLHEHTTLLLRLAVATNRALRPRPGGPAPAEAADAFALASHVIAGALSGRYGEGTRGAATAALGLPASATGDASAEALALENFVLGVLRSLDTYLQCLAERAA